LRIESADSSGTLANDNDNVESTGAIDLQLAAVFCPIASSYAKLRGKCGRRSLERVYNAKPSV
jgi:hypothetical protein